MACGILPGRHFVDVTEDIFANLIGLCLVLFDIRADRSVGLIDLPLRDDKLPVMAQLAKAFKVLRLGSVALDALQESMSHKFSSQALPAFADLLGLWTDWISLMELSKNTVEDHSPCRSLPWGKDPKPALCGVGCCDTRQVRVQNKSSGLWKATTNGESGAKPIPRPV